MNRSTDAQYMAFLESLPLGEVRSAPTKAEFSRPPLASLGDCLAETAACVPQGFTKITGCTESFWRDVPADIPDTPWLVTEAATACLEPAPVTVFVCAGTPPATAIQILEQAVAWLREHGRELEDFTPREPEPAPCAGDCPF